MFKKEDYLEYFAEILTIEQAMEREGGRLLEIIENESARKLIEELVSDERRHVQLVQDMTNIIKKYA